VTDTTRARTILFYRLVCLVLLAIVAVLGLALNRTLLERDRSTKGPVVSQGGSPPQDRAAAAKDPHGLSKSAVSVVDFRDTLAQINHVTARADQSTRLFDSPFGGVRLDVLSPGQRIPLHFQRTSTEVLLPLVGEQEIVYATGTSRRKTLRPTTLTLVGFAPYSAHGGGNLSSARASATLVFATAPHEVGRNVESGDDRLVLGQPPAIVNTAKALLELQPGIAHEMTSLLGAKLALLVVRKEATLEPIPASTFLWVLAGRGSVGGEKDQTIESSFFTFAPRSTPIRIRAEEGRPLLLVVFRPELDGVSDIVKKGQKVYSQFDEELLIRDHFADRHGGVFVDVGAADYKKMSTTYYLEERLGWSGLAIDALGDLAQGYLEHRPRTKFLNYLISDRSGVVQKFYRAPKYLEVSSADKAVARDQQLESLGDDKVDELEVPSTTLNALLAQQGVRKIDFLSMDIEDHEPAALAGFDVNRFAPELVCIEAHPTVADDIFRYFANHGYRRIDEYLPYDSLNWYFTPRTPSK
jgi:FkbM family methyltransferase